MPPFRVTVILPIAILAVILLLVVGTRAVAARFAEAPFDGQPSGGCTDPSIGFAPDDVHLVPGFREHQSWIHFTLPPSPGAIPIVCVRGRGYINPPHAFTPTTTTVSVRTRWVLAHWLAGDLGAYGAPGAWRLLVCYPSIDEVGPTGARVGVLQCH